MASSKSAASDHHELLESLSVEVEAMRGEQSGLVEAASRSDAERSAIAADYAVLVRERQAESQGLRAQLSACESKAGINEADVRDKYLVIEALKAEDSIKKEEAIKKMNNLQIQKLEQIEANEDKKIESKCK